VRHSIKAVAVLGVVVVVVAACSETSVSPSSSLQPGSISLSKAPKVTVCHAAGRAGTTKYVAITISANGLGGHFGNNGTPKAGHELDFIATAERPCNAPEAAQLRICKLSSAKDPSTADLDRSFHFLREDGVEFELKFLGCTEPREVPPGEITLTEPHDPNLPQAFSYYATHVIVTNGTLVSSSGFSFLSRPTIVEDAIVTVGLTSGELTTVTFFNRN